MARPVADELRALGFSAAMIAGATVNGRPLAEAELAKTTQVVVEVHPNGTVRIVIPGPAPGKPRMVQSDKWCKRPPVVRYREWCDRVRAVVGNCIPPAENVVQLNWVAYFSPPESWSKKRRMVAIGTRHRQPPDADNLCKALMDCLWPDGDSAIADCTMRKRWDWVARLEVEIILL